jgi:biopolymer transport protein ExbB
MTDLFAPVVQLYALGGPVVGLLLALSVVAGAVLIAKFWQFWGLFRAERLLAQGADALRAGDVARVRGMWTGGAVLARDLAPLVGSGLSAQDIRDSGAARIAARVTRLGSGLRVLESIAQAAPLIGLFGTVLGMIDAFRAVEAAGAQVNPADLAGGIWVALATTAAGLAVALPVQVLLSVLDGRLERAEAAARAALDAVALAARGARGEQSGGASHG